MRLLLDANLSPRLRDLLRLRGVDALHVADLGLRDAGDAIILREAIKEGRTVVTSDLDFSDLAAALGELPGGVVILRLRSMRPDVVLSRLMAVISEISLAMDDGSVVIVEPNRLRVRKRP